MKILSKSDERIWKYQQGQMNELQQSSSPTHLLLSGHLSRDQQPEEAFRERLLTSWSFRQQLLTLRNAVTPETDALRIKEQRGYTGVLYILNFYLCNPQSEFWQASH